MKKLMIKIAILIVSAVVLFFAANTFLCSPEGIAPEIKVISDIKILELRSDSLKLEITVLALNRNDSDVEIDDIYLKLLHDKDTIGAAFSNEEIKIKSFETSTVNFFANINTPKAVELATEKNTIINLQLKGEVTADLGLIRMPVEVVLEHKFDLKKKLTAIVENDVENNKLIKVETAKLKSLGLGNSTVEIDLILTNPYELDFTVKKYPSHIYINGNEAGKGNLDSEIFLRKKKSIVNGSVIYELSNFKTISSLLGSILKKKLDYRTSGILQLEVLGYNIQFPFNFKGELVKI